MATLDITPPSATVLAVLLALALALTACERSSQADDADGADVADAAAAAGEAQQAAPAPPTPGLAARLRAAVGGSQQVVIVDAQGFGQPMNAATLEVPAGWQVQGGVGWQRGDACIANQLRIAWIAGAPDGSEAFELMHPFSWQLQGRSVPTNPCPVLPLASARDFLLAVAQQRRPGARMLAYAERPDLATKAEHEAQPMVAGVQRRFDAGELLIAYPAASGGGGGGGEVQERFTTSVAFTAIQNSVMGAAGMVFAHRRLGAAPDAQQGARIAASLKTDAQWLAVVRETSTRAEHAYSSKQRLQIDAWHAREMARINAQGAADRAAIRAQTARDIAGIQAQTYANTQATNERMHRRTLEGIGEYNTYRDTSGNAVRSSIHGGSRVLQHPDGTYSSTNDPYLQPPGSVELKRVP